MMPQKMFRAQGYGITLQVGEWPGPGRPVLCLHGLTANLVCFATIAQELSTVRRVLAMDLRGRGLSDKPASGYSLESHGRDIKALLAGLGLEKVALMGHSLGAYISLAFAATYPELVERLVLLDGGGDLSPQQWVGVGRGINPSVERLGRVAPSFAAYLELVRQAPYYDPWHQDLEEYFRYDTEEVAGGVRSRVSPQHIAEERANLAGLKPADFYPRVKCPVLILRCGKGMVEPQDLLLPEDALARMLAEMPDARAVGLPQADHFSIVFQPDPARDQALRDFLAP